MGRVRRAKCQSCLVTAYLSVRTPGDLSTWKVWQFSAGGLRQEIGRHLLWKSLLPKNDAWLKLPRKMKSVGRNRTNTVPLFSFERASTLFIEGCAASSF